MASNEVYSIGWNDKHQLECKQNSYKYATNTNNNEVAVVICDENGMVLSGGGSNPKYK